MSDDTNKTVPELRTVSTNRTKGTARVRILPQLALTEEEFRTNVRHAYEQAKVRLVVVVGEDGTPKQWLSGQPQAKDTSVD